jgi:aminoglycoside phosphotransferase (APT) family kinase protein
VLRGGGHLIDGHVEGVEVRSSDAFNSDTSFLSVSYSQDATGRCPVALVLKRSNATEWGIEAGATEVGFYRRVAQLPNHPHVVPESFAAVVDPEGRASFLLLEDLSETHAPPVTRADQISIVRGMPPRRHIDQVVDTLADLHSYWWQHPAMLETGFEIGGCARDAAVFDAYFQELRRAWAGFRYTEGDALPPRTQRIYDQVIAGLPALWTTHLRPRFDPPRNLTLVHGDAYFANFLTPVRSSTYRAYLIDWQEPSFDLGALDLVNLCVPFWNREQRVNQGHELGVLRRYHQRLVSAGIDKYSWDDLVLDYRVALVDWTLVVVQDAHNGSARDYWQPKMDCLLDAYEDWDCAQLLTTDPASS